MLVHWQQTFFSIMIHVVQTSHTFCICCTGVEDTGSFWPDHHHHHHLRHASVPLHPHHETCNPPFSPKSCAHKKYSSADCLTRNMQMKSGRRDKCIILRKYRLYNNSVLSDKQEESFILFSTFVCV